MVELLVGLAWIVGLVVVGKILFWLAGKCRYIIEDRFTC